MSKADRKVSLSSRVVAAEGQVSAAADRAVLVLRVGVGQYYELRGSATYVWSLLEEPVRVEALRDALVERYDVAQERCERDLLELLTDLVERGLVDVIDAEGVASS